MTDGRRNCSRGSDGLPCANGEICQILRRKHLRLVSAFPSSYVQEIFGKILQISTNLFLSRTLLILQLNNLQLFLLCFDSRKTKVLCFGTLNIIIILINLKISIQKILPIFLIPSSTGYLIVLEIHENRNDIDYHPSWYSYGRQVTNYQQMSGCLYLLVLWWRSCMVSDWKRTKTGWARWKIIREDLPEETPFILGIVKVQKTKMSKSTWAIWAMSNRKGVFFSGKSSQ